MPSPRIDLNLFVVFEAIYNKRNLTHAADLLCVTQPAVSKRVAQLEEHLNATLFDRIGRTITLTEAGAALLPHARAVQLELQAAEQSVRDLSGEVRGRLRLATSHHIGLHRLPPVLSFFSRTFPAVRNALAQALMHLNAAASDHNPDKKGNEARADELRPVYNALRSVTKKVEDAMGKVPLVVS